MLTQQLCLCLQPSRIIAINCGKLFLQFSIEFLEGSSRLFFSGDYLIVQLQRNLLHSLLQVCLRLVYTSGDLVHRRLQRGPVFRDGLVQVFDLLVQSLFELTRDFSALPNGLLDKQLYSRLCVLDV